MKILKENIFTISKNDVNEEQQQKKIIRNKYPNI